MIATNRPRSTSTSTSVAALCLSAMIMISRIAQNYSCCCMAFVVSNTSTHTSSRTIATVRTRSSLLQPATATAGAGSPVRCSFVYASVGTLSRRSATSRRAHTSTSLTSLRASIGSEDVVTSTKGATVKKFKSLASKKRKRTEENATIVEGQRLVFDLLADATTRDLIKHVMVEEDSLPDQTLEELLSLAAGSSSPPKITFATSAVVKACSDTVTPQGVIAIASLPAPYQYDARGCSSSTCSGSVGAATRTYLVLETSDPGNAGTLIRSALACSVEAVILMPGSCDVWNPKTVRSAMTASFKIPLLRVDSWDECKERLQEFGVRLEYDFYAATMEGSDEFGDDADDAEKGATSSLPYYDVDWVEKSAKASVVCVGKEGPGLSAPIRRAVREGEVRAVHVPMAEGIESLNAAVSGSVILFEIARQRRMQA